VDAWRDGEWLGNCHRERDGKGSGRAGGRGLMGWDVVVVVVVVVVMALVLVLVLVLVLAVVVVMGVRGKVLHWFWCFAWWRL
jgi:hypothetical protein